MVTIGCTSGHAGHPNLFLYLPNGNVQKTGDDATFRAVTKYYRIPDASRYVCKVEDQERPSEVPPFPISNLQLENSCTTTPKFSRTTMERHLVQLANA